MLGPWLWKLFTCLGCPENGIGELEIMTDRVLGTVKSYNVRDGYGFIGCEDSRDLVFVHHSAIQDGNHVLEKGQVVEFSVEESPKGIQAAFVKPR
jgi:cold shock CspA family protein